MGTHQTETRVWENQWISIAFLPKKTKGERKKNFALIAESRDTSRALITMECFPLPHNRETSSTREKENNLSAPSRNDSTTLIRTFIASISIYQTNCVTPRKSLEISVSLFTTSGRTVETQALINSGAGGMFIDEDFVKHIGLPLKRLAKPIPVYNVDSTPNKEGIIHKQVTVKVEIDGQSKDLVLLATALGKQCIILGYTWLEDENPDMDWRKNTLMWRTKPHRNIYAMIRPVENEEPDNQNLVISFIKGEMTPHATEDWISSRMSHLQLFAQNDKKEEKPVKEIVPKEFHKYLKTVFTEREIGRLPP